MNCHYRFYDLEYFFSETSKLGYRHCEIWTSPHHFTVDYRGYDDVSVLLNLTKKYGMEIICICPEQTNPKPHNIATGNKEKQDRVLQYFKNVIDVANEVGCNKVVITSGWAFYNENKEDAYYRSVAMMKKICSYAEDKNVVLALEALQPDESVLVNTIDDIKEYRRDVDSEALKVCIDMGAMARVNETIDQYFEAFENDVVHIHFVDGNPTGHLAWGDGTRDMAEDLMSIKIHGYDGYLSLENATSRYFENPLEADKNSLNKYRENGGD